MPITGDQQIDSFSVTHPESCKPIHNTYPDQQHERNLNLKDQNQTTLPKQHTSFWTCISNY